MKKQHLFEYRRFSAIFYAQQRKDDFIVTSFWIWLLLPLRDFVIYSTIMPSLVVIGKQIMEKQTEGGTTCPPPPHPSLYGTKIPQPEYLLIQDSVESEETDDSTSSAK